MDPICVISSCFFKKYFTCVISDCVDNIRTYFPKKRTSKKRAEKCTETIEEVNSLEVGGNLGGNNEDNDKPNG